jgi:hypothetical protein
VHIDDATTVCIIKKVLADMAQGLAKLLTGVLKYNRLLKKEAALELLNPPLVRLCMTKSLV